MCVMCDVVEEGEGEHNGEKREVVIRRITCCSLRTDATNGSSDAGDSAGVFMTISMDYSSRHLDQCDSMTILSNPQRACTDLDRAGLVIGFGISIKCLDLEREKPCLLQEDSAIRSPASPIHGRHRKQPTKMNKRS